MATEYSKQTIDAYFYTMLGLYLYFRPVFVPYNQIAEKALKAGYKLKSSNPDVLEKPVSIGYGLIGVEVVNPKLKANLLHLSGEFTVYRFNGKYSQLQQAYSKIMKDYPQAKTFYHFYDRRATGETVFNIFFR